MTLGQRIRQLRQSRGMTQAELGGGELSKGFISLLEKDRTKASVETLARIALKLGTTIDGLLSAEEHAHEVAAQSLLSLSQKAIRNRRFDHASILLQSVFFLSDSYGLDEGRREALLQDAKIALEQRRFDDAWRKAHDVNAESEQAHDLWRRGRALLLMGWTKIRQRGFREALTLLEEAQRVLRAARAGRDPARTETLIAMGTALIYVGDFEGAVRRYEEAAASDNAKHDPVLRGRALWGTGLGHRKLGNHEKALGLLLQAKEALESAEELRDLMHVLWNIGQTLHERGEHREALQHLMQALRVVERLEMPADATFLMTEVARVHIALANMPEAEHFAQESLSRARRIGDLSEVAEAQWVLARIEASRGNTDRATDLLQEALSKFDTLEMQAKVAEVARDLGQLVRSQGGRGTDPLRFESAKPEEVSKVIDFHDPKTK